jgi:hypothetical protein
MWRRPRTLVAALVVGVAALVPLFGDPRATPVTHPLWARLLLRSLEIGEAMRTSTQASQVFAMLAWRDSLSLPADGYQHADGLTVRREAGHAVVSASLAPAEVTYALAVVQPGDYLLRARIAGPSGSPVTAEIAPVAGTGAPAVVTFAPAPALGWVFGGATHLDPGSYQVQFLLSPGCSLAHIEVAPPCLNPIEPPGGWHATGITTSEDLAVTAVKALDAEPELPPAASPIDVLGSEFLIEAPREAIERRAQAANDPARTALSASSGGLRAVASFELAEAGLYSFFALGAPGAGQRWLVDGCRKVVVCAGEGERWRPILTQRLAPGRHVLALTLGTGATLQHVRIERKKDAPADYVATLLRLGFVAGPPGPVTRAKALDAATFVRDRRRALLAAKCGDPVMIEEAPPMLTAHAPSEPSERTSPQQPPPVKPPVTPVEPPIGPPILPPQPPATPTQPAEL